VSHRQRTENLLRLYSQILDSMAEGVVLIRAEDQRIVYTSGRFNEMFGYAPGELVGRDASILRAPGEDPELTSREEIRTTLERDGQWFGQVRDVRKDGTPFWCEVHVSAFEHHEFGKVWCSVRQDITERREIVDALNQIDERRLYTLERLSPVGIFRTDAEGRCTYVNRTWRELAGLSLSQSLGEGWVAAVEPPDRKRVRRRWDESLQRRAPFKIEYRLRGRTSEPDGKRKSPARQPRWGATAWVLAHALPELDAAGHLVGYIGTVTDISERRRAEVVLRRAQVTLRQSEARYRATAIARETLLREVHHRVKNNLQIVASLLMLQLGHVKDPHVRVLVGESQARIEAIALVHEKLCQSEDLTRVDLGSYIAKVVDGVRASFGSQGRDILVTVTTDRVLVASDTAVNCGLIVNELVSNALKHAFPRRKQGRVIVSLHQPHRDEVVLRISDDGVGMDPAIGLDSVHTLGLQLVRHLTEQLGGAITVERDLGTQFSLRFTIPSKLATATELRTAIPVS
jgi:PAS domain S-box-containing protein